MRVRTLITATLIPLTLAGCLRRIEVIEVAPDGSVKLTTRIEGEAADVREGSAMPAEATGWSVERKEEADGDKDKIVLTARQSLAAGAALPDSYAVPGSATAALDLHFPTALRIEKRPEGTYYHFVRRYQPRRHAQFNYFQDKLIKSGDVQELAEKNPKELTDDERAKLADRFIQVDLLRTEEFVAAAAELQPLPQTPLLKAQLALQPVFGDSQVRDETISLLRGDSDDNGPGLTRLAERLKSDVRKTIERVLHEEKVPDADVQAFLAAYDRVRTAYDLSEDLGDDVWAVALRMPGKIIAHNCFDEETQPAATAADTGDPMAALLEDGDFPRGPDWVGWSFEGSALYDREVVLMATSFVPADAK